VVRRGYGRTMTDARTDGWIRLGLEGWPYGECRGAEARRQRHTGRRRGTGCDAQANIPDAFITLIPDAVANDTAMIMRI
jgi:hypothetical protein